MASSVTDGWLGIAAEGDPDAARLVPDGVRDGSWCRSQNIPHLGCRPTARARGCRHTSAHPQVEAVTPGSSVVADELHVRVRTLRAAAHDGRLAATFGPRPYFGKVTARATREAGARFMATWYRRTYGRGRRRLVAVCRVTVPANYAATLMGLRLRLGVSQQALAAQVGAAGKAVVYQWESGKRRPAPTFWLRIERLQRQLETSHTGFMHQRLGTSWPSWRAEPRRLRRHCQVDVE